VEHDLAILSPEKTILTYRLAGIGSRILAQVLDVMLIIAVLVGVGTLAAFVSALESNIANGIIMMSSFLVPFLYFILFEWLWNGQTIGKKAAGLRVRMDDGTPVTFTAALTRNLIRPADFLPGVYFAGLITIFMNPKSQQLGDLVAKTVVIHEKRAGSMYVMAPHVVGIHPFESAVGDLRGMNLDEYEVLRRFCDRFPELTVETQTRLTKEVWLPIAERRKVPSIPGVHPLYLAEAVVMKYGRQHGLL
jgi:uncharacterized RDD family membrane protein YckC